MQAVGLKFLVIGLGMNKFRYNSLTAYSNDLIIGNLIITQIIMDILKATKTFFDNFHFQ